MKSAPTDGATDLSIKYPSLGTFGIIRENHALRRRIHRLIVRPRVNPRAAAVTISVLLLIVAFLLTPEHTHLRQVQAQNEGICGRTPEVRDVILLQVQRDLPTATCADVTSAELAAITVFNVSDPITGVFLGYIQNYSNSTLLGSDFAGLTSLSELEISASPMLKSIPANAFMGTPALTRLLIHTTGVETIHERALAGLGNLQVFQLSRNPISELPPNLFRDGTSLNEIHIIENTVQFIPNGLFNNLSSLGQLSLDGNRISVIDNDAFQGLSSLTDLHLTDNEISRLPDGVFEDLSSLANLWLVRNELSTLPADIFSGATGLQTLRLQGNLDLQTIDAGAFNGLGELTRLELQDSGLISLPEDVFEPLDDSLGALTLHGNNLTSLPEDIFDGLTGLRTIFLRNNELASLPEEVFEGLVALRWLDLESNELTDLPDDIFDPLDDSLRWLFLSNNKISTLQDDVFDGLHVLNWLLLGGNSLEALPTNLFEPLDNSLAVLKLHDNEIAMLHEDIFDGLTGLTDLDLRDNQLAALHENIFDGMAALEFLSLANNQLASLETDLFDPLDDSFLILHLEGNTIASLDQQIFDGLTGLRRLYLAGNQIASMHADLFDPLDEDLQTLVLGSNDLTALPVDIFDGLTGLTGLDLSCNSIAALDLTRFSPFAASLISLDISGNPFNPQPTSAAVRAALTNLVTLGLGANTECRLPNDATLTSLSVQNAELVPSFDPAITGYRVEVPSSAQHVTIAFAVSDPLAVFTVDTDDTAPFEDAAPDLPGYQLQLGMTGYGYGPQGRRFSIHVTSENGLVTKIYDVEVIRRFPVAKETRLVELALKDIALDSEFESDDEVYDVKVLADVTQVTVVAVPVDTNATTEVVLDGVRYPEGAVDLLLGWNDIYINVTAEDGKTKRSYRVSVLRGTPQPRASSLQKILRIEPSIRSVKLSAGDEVALSVEVWGRQGLKDNGLADKAPSDGRPAIVWSSSGGGSFQEGRVRAEWRDGVANDREVVFVAPDEPGTMTVSASVLDSGDCLSRQEDETEEEHEVRCRAEIEVTVVRRVTAQIIETAPVNPAGVIPATLSDEDGVAYAILTPVDGGNFAGDGYSLVAGAGAVANGEYIGVSMASAGDASNVGMTWHRYTLGGLRYAIGVVDADGESVSDYGLNEAITACVPLPSELRGNISDIVLAATDASGGTAVLSTSVKITPDGVSVCGKLSTLPVTVAVGKAGSPPEVVAPADEVVVEDPLPDTGGFAPLTPWLIWLALAGMFVTAAGLAAVRRSRRVF